MMAPALSLNLPTQATPVPLDETKGTPSKPKRQVTRKDALDAFEAVLRLVPLCLGSETFGEPCSRPACAPCSALRLLARTKRRPEVSR